MKVWTDVSAVRHGCMILRKPALVTLKSHYSGRKAIDVANAIEPKLSDQWFVKMEDLIKPAVEAAKSGKLKHVPEI